MSNSQCPICYTPLEVRDVAPCMMCGHLPEELEHALSGRHTYAQWRIFGELSLILCDFCQVDFSSYDPKFFELPKNTRLGFGKMDFVQAIDEIIITQDKYCRNCHYRLAFLKFLEQARNINSIKR
jgi:hypothetical protein